ncbi:MAG: hypothetical protein Kapaf2KO_07730 [Candidatus Kapaibacteriales bacterium]
MPGLDLAIDFYDGFNRPMLSPGCDAVEIEIDVPDLCDLFEVTVEKIGQTDDCCIYEIGLEMESCPEYGQSFYKLREKLSVKTFRDSLPQPLSDQDSVEYNDEAGTLTFQKVFCDAPIDSATTFEFYLDGEYIECKTEEIDFANCECKCPYPWDIKKWLKFETFTGDSTCDCIVIPRLDIPSAYDCFAFYESLEVPGNIIPIPENGLLDQLPAHTICLEGGETMEYDINIYSQDTSVVCNIKKEYSCLADETFEPCTPNCDSIQWESDQIEFVIPGCAGCLIEVNYLHRENDCDNTQEVQISSIKTSSIQDSTGCIGCFANFDDLFETSLLEVILKNNMNFRPQNIQDSITICDTTWRVLNKSCWAEYEISETTADTSGISWEKVYHPCDSTECCIVGLRVCRTGPGQGTITVDTIGGSFIPDTCGTDSLRVWQELPNPYLNGEGAMITHREFAYECLDRCSAFFGIDNVTYSKTGEAILEYPVNDFSISVSQINKRLKLDIESPNPIGLTVLTISDLSGRIIYQQQLEIYKGIITLEVPEQELRRGAYILNISGRNNNITKKILVD